MPADLDLNPVQAPPLSVLPESTTPDSDALFAAAMGAAAEAAPPPEPEAPPAAVVPDPVAIAAPAEEVKAEPAPAAEAPKPPPERLAPALLKMLERESALVERESKLKAAESDISALQKHLDDIETAQKKFRYNPVEYIRKMAPDIDLADLAKQLWYEKLGDGAPVEYRATREARSAKGSIDDLRAEMEQKLQTERQRWSEEQAQQQQEAAYHQYVGALGAMAKAVPDEYPLVKSFAQSSPERVQQALFKIAQKHAQATNGEVLTPAECATRLNKELDGLRTALGVAAPAAAAPAPKAPTAPVSTLRNKHTAIQPNRALPDPADEEAKFHLAMAAVSASLPKEA